MKLAALILAFGFVPGLASGIIAAVAVLRFVHDIDKAWRLIQWG